MKKLFLLLPALMLAIFTKAQTEENEFVKSIGSGTLDSTTSHTLVDALKKNPKGTFIETIENILKAPTAHFETPSTPLENACAEIAGTGKSKTKNVFNKIHDGKGDYAIIFLYRNMKLISTKNTPKVDSTFTVDLESLNTLIYHKTDRQSVDTAWDNYLLTTKHIYLVYIDRSDAFFEENDAMAPKSLAKTTVKINYRTSFLRQSFNDLRTVVGSVVDAKTLREENNTSKLQITIIQLDPKRIKAPCDIVLTNKSFNEDKKFTIHEKNFASFQVGLVNNKFNRNNFAFADGNLTVKPDSAQTEEWKSNFYALFEIHIPRDIDNFQPIWKSIFEKTGKNDPWYYLYANTIYRMGMYGGVKISTDPLSNVYWGLNYAITKELYVNFGLTWANEVTPQVTTVTGVTSLDEARKYAKRDYSKPKFSWGLSFAPSQIISMFGIDRN